ncbi:MAG: hypothetical protein AAF318_04595 [Pseudomonadota bacterium]
MARSVVFAYGVVAYVLFLSVFVYLAGFLLEIAVPKAINDPPGGALEPSALLINVSLIALFGVTHSLMARGWFKRWLTRFIPAAAERSTDVVQSSLCLALAMGQWRAMDATIWQVEGAAAFVF